MNIGGFSKIRAVAVVFGFLVTHGLQAMPITNTLTIDGRVWAQPIEFVNLSWNDVNTVCPQGICTAGTLNDFEMTGWAWATSAEVGDLFAAISPHPGGHALWTEEVLPGDLDVLERTGLEPTLIIPFGGSPRHVRGITSNVFIASNNLQTASLVSIREVSLFGQLTGEWFYDSLLGNTLTNIARRTSDIGVWFYQIEGANEVPVPSTLSLVFLSFLLLSMASKQGLVSSRALTASQ